MDRELLEEGMETPHSLRVSTRNLEVRTNDTICESLSPRREERGEKLIPFYWSVAGICCFAAGMRLLGWDRQILEGTGFVRHFDKLGHAVLFGLLSFLFHFLARKQTTWQVSSIVTNCLSVVFLLALLDEYSQLWFPDRSFEHLDLLANVLGAGLIGPWGCLFSRSELYGMASRNRGIGAVVRMFQSRRRSLERDVSRDPNRALKSWDHPARTLRLLLVEDDPWFVRRTLKTLESLNKSLDSWRLIVEVEGTLAGAVRRLDESRFDLVLADLSLPDAQGRRVYDVLSRGPWDVPVVVVTNAGPWSNFLGSDPQQQIDTFSKRRLNPETLFWLVHHSLRGGRGSKARETLGFAQSFGRIKQVSSV